MVAAPLARILAKGCRLCLNLRQRVAFALIPDRSPDWLKFKNPEARAVKREAEEDWGRK